MFRHCLHNFAAAFYSLLLIWFLALQLSSGVEMTSFGPEVEPSENSLRSKTQSCAISSTLLVVDSICRIDRVLCLFVFRYH